MLNTLFKYKCFVDNLFELDGIGSYSINGAILIKLRITFTSNCINKPIEFVIKKAKIRTDIFIPKGRFIHNLTFEITEDPYNDTICIVYIQENPQICKHFKVDIIKSVKSSSTRVKNLGTALFVLFPFDKFAIKVKEDDRLVVKPLRLIVELSEYLQYFIIGINKVILWIEIKWLNTTSLIYISIVTVLSIIILVVVIKVLEVFSKINQVRSCGRVNICTKI